MSGDASVAFAHQFHVECAACITDEIEAGWSDLRSKWLQYILFQRYGWWVSFYYLPIYIL